MRPLSVFDAEAEARWRWGGLLTRGFARYASGQRKPFEVGTRRFGSVQVRGRGASWEAAFRNAATQTNDEPPGSDPLAPLVPQEKRLRVSPLLDPPRPRR